MTMSLYLGLNHLDEDSFFLFLRMLIKIFWDIIIV